MPVEIQLTEYHRLGVEVIDHNALSSPVMINTESGIMHKIHDDGVLACRQVGLPRDKDRTSIEVVGMSDHFAILRKLSRMPYVACRVCEATESEPK